MKSYIKIFAALAIAGSSMLTSCDLSIENPNGPTSEGYFTSQDRYVLNMIAIMAEWRSDLDVTTMKSAGELRAGMFTITGIDGSVLNDIGVINNNIDASNPQFSKFANYYGVIANINNFLKQAESNPEVFTSTEAYNYLRGMAYGMRAYCYFQLYKMYGTVPIRTEAEVFEGNYNALELYKPRAKASEVVALVKSDIEKSLDGFNNGTGFNDARITGVKCNFWTKAATEMLAGEYYLWLGKVSTGDVTADPANIATAKTYFSNVVSNYGFSMQPEYKSVFDTANKGNSEVIFSTYYGLGVQTTIWYWYNMWNPNTGTGQGNWWVQLGSDGITPIEGANRLGYYVDANGDYTHCEWWYMQSNTVNRAMYKNAVYYQYDESDGRRYMFQPCYLPTNAENNLDADGNEIEGGKRTNYIADFNPDDYYMAGAFFYKYRGQIYNNVYQGTNNMIYYRLPLAYMYLAEIANWDGNNGDVERYINMIRQRAFGDKWDATKHAYKAGSFRENEVAILQEKTREFIQEGQRWWDLRRLTAVKGGTDQDHLVFQPDGCVGYGLDLAAHPMWREVFATKADVDKNFIQTNVPVLDYSKQAHMVLWPIANGDVISADDSPTGEPFSQTPGY